MPRTSVLPLLKGEQRVYPLPVGSNYNEAALFIKYFQEMTRVNDHCSWKRMRNITLPVASLDRDAGHLPSAAT